MRQECLEEELLPNEDRQIFPSQPFFATLAAQEAFSMQQAPRRSPGLA